VHLEQELKLTADGGFSAEVLLRTVGQHGRLGEPQLKIVRDVYMDTRSGALARCGLSARWRRVGRAARVQAKPVLLVPGLVQRRVELAAPLLRGQDPGRALKQLLEQSLPLRLRGVPVPQVEVHNRREARVVELEGGCRAELSIDRAEARRPGARSGPRFLELELELLEGDPAVFGRLVQAVAELPGLSPSGTSKHRRALALQQLEVFDPAVPRPSFEADAAADEVARAVCRALWDNVRSYEPGTRLGLDIEYLHKMRVSTRRLRAALRTFDCCFTLRSLEYLQRNLRWLAAELGQVRDMDVQLSQLQQRQASLGPEPGEGWEALRRVLERRQARARQRLLDSLFGARYQRLCTRAPQILGGSPPRRPLVHPGRQPVALLAGRMVGKRVRQVLKAARKVRREPRTEHVHRLRIRGKQLRYVCEFFAPLYHSRFAARVKRLSRFQDVLGLFNDNVVNGELARELRAGALASDSPPALLYVLGQLDAASQQGARAARAEVNEAFSRVGGRKAVQALADEAQRVADRAEQRLRRAARAGVRG
jgi:CHAD domain-containing protein